MLREESHQPPPSYSPSGNSPQENPQWQDEHMGSEGEGADDTPSDEDMHVENCGSITPWQITAIPPPPGALVASNLPPAINLAGQQILDPPREWM